MVVGPFLCGITKGFSYLFLLFCLLQNVMGEREHDDDDDATERSVLLKGLCFYSFESPYIAEWNCASAIT